MNDFSKNIEGYSDPTAGTAYSHILAEQKQEMKKISALMKAVNAVVELAGFEIVGMITFKEKATGKVYK